MSLQEELNKNGWYREKVFSFDLINDCTSNTNFNVRKFKNKKKLLKYHFFFNNIQLCNLNHDEAINFIKVLDLTNEKRVCKRCLHIISTWNDLNNYVTFHN